RIDAEQVVRLNRPAAAIDDIRAGLSVRDVVSDFGIRRGRINVDTAVLVIVNRVVPNLVPLSSATDIDTCIPSINVPDVDAVNDVVVDLVVMRGVDNDAPDLIKIPGEREIVQLIVPNNVVAGWVAARIVDLNKSPRGIVDIVALDEIVWPRHID